MDEKEIKRLIGKAESYCARGEKSPLEVMRKIEVWSDGLVDEKTKKGIIDRLIADRYLDVGRYVSAFVSDKLRFSRYGPVKIRAALREKGIDDRTISDALDDISDTQWMETLEEYLASKMKSGRHDDPFKERDRLYRLGYARGFSGDMIGKALKTLQVDQRVIDEFDW